MGIDPATAQPANGRIRNLERQVEMLKTLA
jgi:hypothetical protein